MIFLPHINCKALHATWGSAEDAAARTAAAVVIEENSENAAKDGRQMKHSALQDLRAYAVRMIDGALVRYENAHFRLGNVETFARWMMVS